MLAALLLAACAAAADAPSLIARAATLVQAQRGKTADEARLLERRLEALNTEARQLGPKAAAPLAAAAGDARKPALLRLWMIVYLQSLEDPEAFPHLRKLLLDRAQPDLLRGAAARAIAAAPVSAMARRRALCASLTAEPGREALREALFSLQKLGCDDPGALERWAASDERAIAALSRSPSPPAVPALSRLFDRFKTGSVERGRVLAALAPHAAFLDAERARAMLAAETRSSPNAQAALRLLALGGDPASADFAGRLLRSRDGGTVVAAAETLAALGAKSWAPEVEKISDGFAGDERFAGDPGRDAVALYDRLKIAVDQLSSTR
jgi:hypothetical protein